MAPLVTAEFLNTVATEGVTEKNIWKLYILLLLFLVRNVTSWVGHGPGRVLEQLNAFHVRASYRSYLTRGVLNMPLDWHVGHHSGDTTDKMNKGADGLFGFAEDSFVIIKSAVTLIGCFGMIVYFNHKAAYIVAAFVVVAALVSVWFDTRITPNYRALSRSENQINENVVDIVANITTVIILRIEKLVFDTIMGSVKRPFDLFKRTVVLNELKWFVTNAFSETMMVIVMVTYLHDHIGAGPGSLGASVYLLLSYLQRMGELFFRFTSNYGSVIRSKLRVMNAEELADEFREESLTNHKLPEDWLELEVRNLTFAYNVRRGSSLHLDNVNLRIRRGARIAFVGLRGSGKTTCLGVMRDLYHPQNIELYADGRMIEGGFAGIKRAIALVPQNPEIFGTRDATIRYNMTMGIPYDEALVQHYINVVSFGDVVAKLPKGLESGVKEKGVNLSGGERQGLALVRGLLACHDKDIVLLDEPTSSFDPITERQVYQNIFREFEGKTIISSVHKLHLLPDFDEIYLFSGGKIVASGPFSELLSTSVDFQNLWKAGTKD